MFDKIVEEISKVNTAVNDVVWGIPMLILLLGVGIYMTSGTGFFQVRYFGHTMSETILAIFRNNKVVKTKDKKAISQFQALATALAATVGTGNIVGVATAIASGGPGAVFWMWVSAFFGMMTNYSENVLGIFYRKKNSKGEWTSGPMRYIEEGLKLKWLAVIFSVFCLIASFGIGNIAQINGISTSLQGSFGIPPWIVGIVLAVVVGFVILGGLKRIVSVTEKLVPVMAALYIIGALIVITMNGANIPAAFAAIFKGAFSLRSAGSGIMGYVIAKAIRFGMARGVFSNEAGLGSSVMVHSSSDVKEPVTQGIWGIFEVFFDTIVICTLTALSILTTGADKIEGLVGVQITTYAFNHTLGSAGTYIITFCILLFAFSTILGWSVYGTRAIEYLGGEKSVKWYKLLFSIVVFIGSISSVQLVWDLSDTFNGLMAIPNLIAVFFLSKQVFAITKNYKDRKLSSSPLDVEPLLSAYPDIQQEQLKALRDDEA